MRPINATQKVKENVGVKGSETRLRNPQTGNAMMLGSRRVVIFKCSGVLKDKINGEG